MLREVAPDKGIIELAVQEANGVVHEGLDPAKSRLAALRSDNQKVRDEFRETVAEARQVDLCVVYKALSGFKTCDQFARHSHPASGSHYGRIVLPFSKMLSQIRKRSGL